MTKKEDIKDVIGYLENWADMVIVRHKDLSLIEYMAEYSHIPIINAMTAVNHPCEILTDLYSLSKKYVDYSENPMCKAERGSPAIAKRKEEIVRGCGVLQR